jgi:uncharacterized protein (TIGR01777 family)
MSQKILVAGATGFVGRNLIPALLNNQYEVSALGRDRNKLEKALPHLKSYLLWQDLDKVSPEEFDIIINLAGENIAEGRWNEKNKAKIINSRVETTSKLVNWCLNATGKTPHLYNTSAIGVYGIQPTQSTMPPALIESKLIHPSKDFLSEVGKAWEDATIPLSNANHPVTLMRFGVVLKRGEGMMKKLDLPFSLGLGSTIGSGNQVNSWINIDDLVAAIMFLLKHPDITGPVNLTAPGSVTQKTFATTLAKTMHRPLLLNLPDFLVEMIFGQMGKELLLGGQNVYPQRLIDSGFVFKYPDLQSAFNHKYGS